MEILYVSQYFMYTPSHVDMCPEFWIYCVLYTRITSHAYSCFCMSMSIDVKSMDVLLHGEITHTLATRALVLTHTRRRCDGGESVADCFLPVPHRILGLTQNRLVCVPLTTQARANLEEYSGPVNLCLSCEAGKF